MVVIERPILVSSFSPPYFGVGDLRSALRSYTPSRISIRIGTAHHDLQEAPAVVAATEAEARRGVVASR